MCRVDIYVYVCGWLYAEAVRLVMSWRTKHSELRREGRARPWPGRPRVIGPAPAQVRNYVLHPYKMVKDLRTGVETGNAAGVLDGDLDPFVQAFLRHKGRGGSAQSQV